MLNERRLRKKDKSTVGSREYITDHILFGAIFGFNLYNFLPVVAPIAYYHQSFSRLILCMVISSVIGIGLTFKYNRTNHGMLGDILCGMGAYTLLTIGVYNASVVNWLVSICIVLTLISLAIIFTNKIKRRDKLGQIILNRIHRSFLLIKRNSGIAGAFALVIIPVAVHFTPDEKIVDTYYEITGYEVSASQFDDCYEVVQAYGDRYMLSENIDVIKKIRNNDEFQTLNYEEKCEVIEAITYCEARYLGLCEINLEFKELSDTTLGQYNHSTRTITINSKPLKDGTIDGGSNEEILATVLHECRHCYQHLLAEMYANATPEQRNLYAFTHEGVADWITNMNNYSTASDNGSVEEYLNYMKQPIEEDARSWAYVEVKDYFYCIDEYTKELESNE